MLATPGLRWACVDVPALPLQLLLRGHPDWASAPVVVVEQDKPQGEIQWVNERARRRHVLPGRSYAEGLALAADLRAAVVDGAEVTAAVASLLSWLRAFTPEVEPSEDEPGVFWLNASGIKGLYPSLEVWAGQIVARLAEGKFRASIAVGFDRFNTYALARSSRGVQVLSRPQDERRRADAVRLQRLALAPKLRDALDRLGIVDVGGFRQLPAGGVLARFGAAAHRLHRSAHGELWAPLVPAIEEPAAHARMDFDPDQHEIDTSALLFLAKQRLAPIAAELARQGKAVAGLHLRLLFDKGPPRQESIRPAEPTLDEVQLVDLLRLRLESVRLDSELEAFELSAETVPASARQRQLFQEAHARDLDAGNRALARLRAEFGDGAVVCAEVREGHLPQARYGWTPLQRLRPAEPRSGVPLRLVRRVLARPRLLSNQSAGPDGWFLGGFGCGPLQNLWGPYVISGGWWHNELHREYYYAETRRGDLLWIYYDRPRRSWFLQGTVE